MKKIIAVILFCTTVPLLHAETPAKAALCSACHGQQGISTNPHWPNLAGQHASYLIKQLKEYKQGSTRHEATMTAILASINEEEMTELATFYSKQPLPQHTSTENHLTRGEQLYRLGDFSKHIAACIACHGPRGTGNNQAGFPALAGQHALYTIAQLQAFKDKKRSNDFNAIMRDLSARMSQEDIEAVAYYIQDLH